MYEIAHGIEVYYENKKEVRNIVFFTDGSYKYYSTGEMLFEIISDEAIYMITEKVSNMIKIFPDSTYPLTIDGVTSGYRWLYETVADENLPVATELFRSSFNEVIHLMLRRIEAKDTYDSVGEFLMNCYEQYMEDIQTFSLFVDCVSADVSNIADEFQKDVAQVFVSFADKMYECYTRKCNVRHIEGDVSINTRQITNFLQLFIFEFCRIKKEGKAIKQCSNCGRYFIPPKRNDSIYCQAPSIQNPNKTCAEIGPQFKRNKRRQSDLEERGHHNTICKLYNMVRRAKEKGDSKEFIKKYEKQIDEEMKRYADERDKTKSQGH